jgi:D-alanyl-D-alanine dipeptidase
MILAGIPRPTVSAFAQPGPFDSAQDRPPKDAAATRVADLVELVKLDPTIKLDIRYAGTNNFLGKPVYKESRASLQRPAAEALLKAHRELAKSGYGLMIHDGYPPWAITKRFWDMTYGFQREFVANRRPARSTIAAARSISRSTTWRRARPSRCPAATMR